MTDSTQVERGRTRSEGWGEMQQNESVHRLPIVKGGTEKQMIEKRGVVDCQGVITVICNTGIREGRWEKHTRIWRNPTFREGVNAHEKTEVEVAGGMGGY